jgi:hypothetical protein
MALTTDHRSCTPGSTAWMQIAVAEIVPSGIINSIKDEVTPSRDRQDSFPQQQQQ